MTYVCTQNSEEHKDGDQQKSMEHDGLCKRMTEEEGQIAISSEIKEINQVHAKEVDSLA